MTRNLDETKEQTQGSQVVKEALSKSAMLSMLGNELGDQISPLEANEILAATRRAKDIYNKSVSSEAAANETLLPQEREKKLSSPLEKSRIMAKEMTQNWFTSIGKYSEIIPYDEGDNKGAIYWDAMRLSYSFGFENFSNGQPAKYGEPFMLDKPIRKMYGSMNSRFSKIRNGQFKAAEEKFMETIMPLVEAFENADEIEIEFIYDEPVQFVSAGLETNGNPWKPVSWKSRVIRTKITKQDFMENYKRGFVRVACWHGQNIDFITFNMLKSIISKK